jgi:DnaD/phage-associated family protein
MSSTIFRIKKEDNYTVVNNYCLRDNRLSWKAKGLLVYLLSLPDDWQIYQDELIQHSTDGISSTSSGIRELMEYGYIKRERRRNEQGHLKGYIYTVYEQPLTTFTDCSPRCEKPKTEKPITENRMLLNTNNTKYLKEEEEEEGVIQNEQAELNPRIEFIYRKNISNRIGELVKSKLIALQLTYGIELLHKAIEVSIERGGNSVSYVESVLKDWKKQKLKTTEQVDKYLLEWKEGKRRQQQRKYSKRNCDVPQMHNYEEREYDDDFFENLRKRH